MSVFFSMALPIQWLEGLRRSRIFMSCIFMSLHLVLHFQVQHFLVLHFLRTPPDFENLVRRSFCQQHSLTVKLVDNTFNGHVVMAGLSIICIHDAHSLANVRRPQPSIISSLQLWICSTTCSNSCAVVHEIL